MSWPPPSHGTLSLHDFADEVDYGEGKNGDLASDWNELKHKADDESGALVFQSNANNHPVSVQSEQIFLGTLLDGSKNEVSTMIL